MMCTEFHIQMNYRVKFFHNQRSYSFPRTVNLL